MKIKLSILQELIKEHVNSWHANHYTTNNLPMGYEDYPEVDIEQYMDVNSKAWSVEITCSFDDDLSEPKRIFKSEEDASTYARKKADRIHTIWLSTQA